MRTHRIRALAALVSLGAMSLATFAFAAPAGAATPGQVVITEWMYNPAAVVAPTVAGSEFVEITNVGGETVDMTNYSFDDASNTPGSFSLATFNTSQASKATLAPGESALIVEVTAAAFRTEWALPPTTKIAELNGNNLGRADEVNIYNGAALADRLTYDDQTFTPSIRTVGVSGVPTSCLTLGANNVRAWVFSSTSDGITTTSASGNTGSPGVSPLNQCGPVTIVDNHGTGAPPAPLCLPEAASGTGPAPASAQSWPGAATVTVADNACAWKTTTGPEGRDISGLVFDPTNSDVLYAAKNKNWVFRLVRQGDLWVADTTNDWGAGKQIFFPGSVNLPDAEGLTVGADGALYVTTERDNAHNSISLDSVLRFDPTAAGTTLVPTTQWDLTVDFPELLAPGKANLGFEGITFVPDTYLVQHGFVDQSIGSVYYPSDYPGHGDGLFFAALENDGKLYAYALNADGSFHRVAVVDPGMGHTMDVQYDAGLQRIWALCDNTCAVSSALLKIDASGNFTTDVIYQRPATLPNVNIEGFAIAPLSTCADGAREVVWSDDGISAPGHEGHALYRGTFPCDLDLGPQGAPATVDLGARGPGDETVPKKGTLFVRGSGFIPGEAVRVELHVKKKVDVLATVVADDFGLAVANVTIPTGVQPKDAEVWLVAPSATATAVMAVEPTGHK